MFLQLVWSCYRWNEHICPLWLYCGVPGAVAVAEQQPTCKPSTLISEVSLAGSNITMLLNRLTSFYWKINRFDGVCRGSFFWFTPSYSHNHKNQYSESCIWKISSIIIYALMYLLTFLFSSFARVFIPYTLVLHFLFWNQLSHKAFLLWPFWDNGLLNCWHGMSIVIAGNECVWFQPP